LESTGVKGFDANEYGATGEQNPGHSAWFLARFDRAGMRGLRGNWSDPQFFSNMGDLVAANWMPNRQYWVYKRYADQTGLRTSVTAGTQVDAVAYQDACAAKSIIVVGNKGGTTESEKMPTGTAALSAPVVISNAAAAVTCNALTVTIKWARRLCGHVDPALIGGCRSAPCSLFRPRAVGYGGACPGTRARRWLNTFNWRSIPT
jgi:hypothetical protein